MKIEDRLKKLKLPTHTDKFGGIWLIGYTVDVYKFLRGKYDTVVSNYNYTRTQCHLLKLDVI